MKPFRGGAGTDLLLFIAFIIVLGVAWYFMGGPERDLSRQGPFLNPPFPLGSGEGYFLSIPSVNIPEPDTASPSPEANEGWRESSFFSDFLSGVRRGGADEKKSPHAEYVSLSQSQARSTDPQTEYLTIKISSQLTGTLSISDWRIESTVSTLGFPLGSASYLPFAGQVNYESPIAVGPHTTLYVVTGRSPIGVSFRNNICAGYFTQFQNFTPSISRECPAPTDELRAYVEETGGTFIPNDQCLNYIRGIGRCVFTIDATPLQINSACRKFITEELNYDACVDRHKSKSGFYKNEWHLYLERNAEVWRQETDRIRLLDENGLVIDTISY